MSSTEAKAGGGLFFLVGLLTIAFVVLRLVGVTDWAWLWVLSPLWIYAALWVLRLVLALSFWATAALIAYFTTRGDRRTNPKGGRR